MAPRGELAEEPGYAVRGSRAGCQTRRGNYRRKIPNSRVCGRRDRARLAGARCGAGRHRRARSHRDLLLLRQGSDIRPGHRRMLRHEHAPAECLVVFRRRFRGDGTAVQGIRLHRAALRKYRLPDGRLVPQGDQIGRRPEGHEDEDRWHGRPGPGEAGRRAAADRRSGYLSGAREGHDRCGRMGGTLRRREARLQQGRQELLLSRLLGRWPDADDARQRKEVERAAQALPGRAHGGVR